MKSKYICDIIIENAIKDWKNSMNNQNRGEIWAIEPKYSKSEINKAGSIIADQSLSKEDRDNALIILNNWRSSHIYPLRIIYNSLQKENPDAIVVQRLKRLESIVEKIKRFPKMELYRMQDLGGCRVIVDTIAQVYEAVNRYKKSCIKHIFKKENDYIQEPQKSGYRSYHMIYKFKNDEYEIYNNNMLIEIQFRTKLQHIWATAVEMMGVYTRSNLKSSQGDQDILRFFILVSSVIAIQEKMPVCPNTSNDIHELVNEIKKLNLKHRIIPILSGINLAIDYTEKKLSNKNVYYLLILDYSSRQVHIRQFKSSQLEAATKAYGNIEKETDKNVVLVSAKSFNELREAYPNYFVDISEFISMVQDIIKNN